MELFLQTIGLGYIMITLIFYLTVIFIVIALYFYLRKRFGKDTKIDLGKDMSDD
jgi:hypothetical protein